MSSVSDKDLIAVLEAIASGKLFSELDEQTVLNASGYFAGINTGEEDAKSIDVSLLRGFSGDWNPITNIPTLSNSEGLKGSFYRVSVNGTRDLGSGAENYQADNLIYYHGTKWVNIIQNDLNVNTIEEDGDVSTSYTFDLSSGSDVFYLTMTGDTDFTLPNVDIGKVLKFIVILDGDYTPTFLNTDILSPSVIYDGNKKNKLKITCVRLANNTQLNSVFIQTDQEEFLIPSLDFSINTNSQYIAVI